MWLQIPEHLYATWNAELKLYLTVGYTCKYYCQIWSVLGELETCISEMKNDYETNFAYICIYIYICVCVWGFFLGWHNDSCTIQTENQNTSLLNTSYQPQNPGCLIDIYLSTVYDKTFRADEKSSHSCECDLGIAGPNRRGSIWYI